MESALLIIVGMLGGLLVFSVVGNIYLLKRVAKREKQLWGLLLPESSPPHEDSMAVFEARGYKLPELLKNPDAYLKRGDDYWPDTFKGKGE